MNDHQYHLSIKELHASVDGKKILNEVLRIVNHKK